MGPWDHPRIHLVQLIDCGFALAWLDVMFPKNEMHANPKNEMHAKPKSDMHANPKSDIHDI